MWASPVSASVKFRVPAGTVVVASIAAEPVVASSSNTEADSGPLVIATGWLVPRIVIVTSWVSVPPEGSWTFT